MKNYLTALGDCLEVSEPLKKRVYQSTFIREKTPKEWMATEVTPGVRHLLLPVEEMPRNGVGKTIQLLK